MHIYYFLCRWKIVVIDHKFHDEIPFDEINLAARVQSVDQLLINYKYVTLRVALLHDSLCFYLQEYYLASTSSLQLARVTATDSDCDAPPTTLATISWSLQQKRRSA